MKEEDDDQIDEVEEEEEHELWEIVDLAGNPCYPDGSLILEDDEED